MYRVCQVCHTACSTETKVCPNCGTKLPAPNTPHTNGMWDDHGHPHSSVAPEAPRRNYTSWNDNTHPHSTTAPTYRAAPVTPRPANVPTASHPGQRTVNGRPILGMAWYNFLTRIFLIANAVIVLLCGVVSFSGGLSENSEYLYLAIPELETIDVIYGYALVGLAIFILFVRGRLAAFKQGAHKLLLLLPILSVGVSIVYSVASFLAISQYTDFPVDNFSTLFAVILCNVAFFLANYTYFKPREHLFVNI